MLGLRALSARRREVRLSRPGKVFVAFTLAIGFAAVNTGNNMLFLIVSMMLALMILSGVAALINLGGITVVLIPGQGLQARCPGLLRFELHNARPWTVWLIELRLNTARRVVPRLGARHRVEISLPWTPGLRGYPPLPALLLGSSFPFAFVWRGQDLGAKIAAAAPWVAPAPAPQISEPGVQRLDVGQRQKALISGQGDVLGPRPWRLGEALHEVWWRRSDWSQGTIVGPTLWVLEREQESRRRWQLDYADPRLAPLDHEARLQVLCAQVQELAAGGREWCLQLPNGRRCGMGKQGLAAALQLLAVLTPWPDYPADRVVRPWWQWWRR